MTRRNDTRHANSRDACLHAWGQSYTLTALYSAKQWLANHPKDALILTVCGSALGEIGYYREALRYLRRAIHLSDGENAVQFLAIGHVYKNQGKWATAAKWYAKAIGKERDHARGYVYLGAVLARQGRFAEALAAHRKATACSRGETSEAYLNVGLNLSALGRLTAAANAIRKSLVLDPEYREAKHVLQDIEAALAILEPKARSGKRRPREPRGRR